MRARSRCIRAAFAWRAGVAPRADDGGGRPDPDAPTVGASLDKTEAHVGDRLTLTVSAVAKAGIAVTLPAKLDARQARDARSQRRRQGGRDLGDGRRSHRFVLGVAAYEVGELEVPPIERLPISTPAARCAPSRPRRSRCTSRPLVADDEAHPELAADPPAALGAGRGRARACVRCAGARIGLGGALALALLRAADPARAAPARAARWRRPTVPRRAARGGRDGERCGRCARRGDFERDGYRPFYFAVAEIVRDYLGARYGFDALELTTTELARRARRARAAPASSRARRWRASSTTTDLVKFAKAGSTDGDALAALDAAQAIVLSTAAPLETAAQSAAGPGAAAARLPHGRPRGRRWLSRRAPLWVRVLDALAPYLLTVAIALPLAALLLRCALRGPRHPLAPSWALLLLAAVPLVAWVGFHLERRRAGTFVFSRTHELQRHRAGAVRAALAPAAGAAAGGDRAGRGRAGAAAAARRPIRPRSKASTSWSRSTCRTRCRRPTWCPTASTAAKRVIDDFIQRRPTDRIGLVIFGKEAFTQCPLTLDTARCAALLADVRLGLVDGQGTAIGNALGTAINRLRKSTAQVQGGRARHRR